MRQIIKRIPLVGPAAARVYHAFRGRRPFPGTKRYWELRYRSGANSGAGSYGELAEFKAEVINRYVAENEIRSVIEFGSGDGNQLTMAVYPSYLGFDVSKTAVRACRARFENDRTKEFRLADEYAGEMADLTLSLDVIYHLVEDEIFDEYMRRLFAAAKRHVVIYSSNTDDNRGYEGTYVRHRKFTDWIAANVPGWNMTGHIPNRYPYRSDDGTGSFADFYIYETCELPAAVG